MSGESTDLTALIKKIPDADIRATVDLCASLKLQILVPAVQYRLDGKTQDYRNLMAILAARAPLVNGRSIQLKRLDLGLTFYEGLVGIVDPFIAARAKFGDKSLYDEKRAWELARQAGAMPLKFHRALSVEAKAARIEQNASILLCYAAQVKRRLRHAPKDDLAFAFVHYGEASGSGKSSFIKRLMGPLGELKASYHGFDKLLQGFDGAIMASKIALISNDPSVFPKKLTTLIKSYITEDEWRVEEKMRPRTTVPANATLVFSFNERPLVQFPDDAMTRRLGAWEWYFRIPTDQLPEWHERILPNWDAEEFWRVAPETPPKAAIAALLRSRESILPESPLLRFINEYLSPVEAPASSAVPLKALFAAFLAVAEDNNWLTFKVTDRDLAERLQGAGYTLTTTKGLTLVRNIKGNSGLELPNMTVEKAVAAK